MVFARYSIRKRKKWPGTKTPIWCQATFTSQQHKRRLRRQAACRLNALPEGDEAAFVLRWQNRDGVAASSERKLQSFGGAEDF